jgi:hypothetical protein
MSAVSCIAASLCEPPPDTRNCAIGTPLLLMDGGRSTAPRRYASCIMPASPPGWNPGLQVSLYYRRYNGRRYVAPL